MTKTIFLPGNVPSLKNSRGIGMSGQSFNGAPVRKYLYNMNIRTFSSRKKEIKMVKKGLDNLFLQTIGDQKYERLHLGLHFVREDRRRFDFCNMVQIIADLLTAHEIIPDDNMNHFLPYPLEIDGCYHSILPSKKEFKNSNLRPKPGVWLKFDSF
jgi:hypothetical protein